ncbi:MAG: exodeoxyribonuclease III [Dehalococcoidia bacterium]|nr:exodeoxyribonuclease III [Dehalococcoidia bacterium]
MTTLTICSWNINGLRATLKTGDLHRWLEISAPDVVGMQEVKGTPDQCDASAWEELGYTATWHPAERPGYSGALLLTKVPPVAVVTGLGIDEFDREGRVIQAEYPGVTVLTAYFPNGGNKGVRLDYKYAFYAAFIEHIDRIVASGREVLFMGDLNVAHTELDVARPEEAIKGTGFLPAERAWLDRLVQHGYVDTFRAFRPDQRDAYSYWDAWRDRRARNIGWRIDYVWVSRGLLPAVKRAFIQPEIMGSDHCPVGVELELPGQA